MTFDEQLDEILAAIPRRHRIPFLAGTRFAAGFQEYGDGLFEKDAKALRRDEREEQADEYTYRHRRRWLSRWRRWLDGR